MSADLLRRAATRLREHAAACDPPPWAVRTYLEATERVWEIQSPDRPGYTTVATVRTDVSDPEDAAKVGASFALIALMHPPVALALATVLDGWADAAVETDKHLGYLPADYLVDELALARAILREAADAAEAGA